MSPRRKVRSGSSRGVESSARGRKTVGVGSRTPFAALRGASPAVWTIGLALLAVAVVFDPRMKDGFRLPKLWLAELLVLVSLALLTWRLVDVDRLELRAVLRSSAVRAGGPLLLAAAIAAWASDRPLAVGGALASLAIAVAALVGWSTGLPRARLRGLLTWLLVPGVALAVLAVLQYHDLFRPFGFSRGEEANRLGVTSLAGSPSDLGAFLALAALVAQMELRRRRGRTRWVVAAALAVMLYGLVVTQTLTALAALGLASVLFWGLALPRKRRLPALASSIALAALVIALAPPVRHRVVVLGRQIGRGNLNAALSGRLDGWRVALRMLRDHPLTGVGPGAFEASYVDTKLELVDEGVPFFAGQPRVVFSSSHNEFLDAAAEWGVLGLLALGWALWWLVRPLLRLRDGPGAGEWSLAWAGLFLLAVLSMTYFPFQIALTAYPALVFLAWVLSFEEEGPAARDGGASDMDAAAGAGSPEGKGAKSAPGMSAGVGGWTAFCVLFAVVLGALVLQGWRYRDHWRAARVLRVVEFVTQQMVRSGRGNPTLLWRHVSLLREAERLDPAEAAIPLAEGSQFRLLQRADEAEEAYRRALALEPRPEIWLNLGAAQAMAGDEEQAHESFLKAVKVDPRMLRNVPEPYRSQLPSRRQLLNRPPRGAPKTDSQTD